MNNVILSPTIFFWPQVLVKYDDLPRKQWISACCLFETKPTWENSSCQFRLESKYTHFFGKKRRRKSQLLLKSWYITLLSFGQKSSLMHYITSGFQLRMALNWPTSCQSWMMIPLTSCRKERSSSPPAAWREMACGLGILRCEDERYKLVIKDGLLENHLLKSRFE